MMGLRFSGSMVKRAAAAMLAIAAWGTGLRGADLDRNFQSPPASARPHTWWHWMDGNISRAGITQDLEAMRRVGIGGVQIFDCAYEIPEGPVKFASPEWRELLHFATQEAQRLGMEVGIHNCSGWSSTGGPWVTPDMAMQSLVITEAHARAEGGRVEMPLPQPSLRKYAEFYHDIAVLAFPTAAADRRRFFDAHPAITSSAPGITPAAFAGPADRLDIKLPGALAGAPQWIQFAFDEPYPARSVHLRLNNGRPVYPCELQASDDGKTFRTLATASVHYDTTLSTTFPEVKAKFYRIYLSSDVKEADPITLQAFNLTDGYRLPGWNMKANFADLRQYTPSWDDKVSADALYPRTQVVDITDKVDGQGKLAWSPPAAAEGDKTDWTILRVGYAPNGRMNHPATPAGEGLEVDKLNKAAVDLHFAKFLDGVLKDAGPLAGSDATFTTLLIDSYETGPQNWSAGFREEFQKRRGYDLLPYLPAFTGRVVDSPDVTERFLFDVRTTVAELFKENYFEHFRDLCRQRHMKFALEPYDGPFDTIDTGMLADLPMSEFWNRKPSEGSSRTRYVASAAHLSGHEVVGAESFTSTYSEDKYTSDPASLKPIGDFQFCEGINRIIFHRYAHQPWPAGQVPDPGMTMGPWGLHFERTVTWWEQSKPWLTYLARCQYLLQSGQCVADVLCFSGETQRVHARWDGRENPPVPAGYDWEFASTALLQSAKVDEQHRIVMPNGLAFRCLLLPELRAMTPGALEAIERLVASGATVVGPPPQHNQSLAPGSDAAFRQKVADVWGTLDGKDNTWRLYKQGQVFWGRPMAEVLKTLRVEPDVGLPSREAIRYKHRAFPGIDLYFLSNQTGKPLDATCTFRIADRAPELWHPETGEIEAVPYAADSGVALHFEPGESVFVVFRNPRLTDDAVVAGKEAGATIPPGLTLRDGQIVWTMTPGGTMQAPTRSGKVLAAPKLMLPQAIGVRGPWKVSFQQGRGAPESATFDALVSWTERPEPGIRYFAGTATYSVQFEVPGGFLTPEVSPRETRVGDLLDLGQVRNIAEVRINGQDAGTLWHAPFRAEVSKLLRAGANTLEIRITNTWANRLIGDEQLSDDCEWVVSNGRGMHLKGWPDWLVNHQPRPSPRIAFSTWKFYTRDAPLLPSGLMGPVTITPVATVPLR